MCTGLLEFSSLALPVPYTIKQFPFYILLGILGKCYLRRDWTVQHKLILYGLILWFWFTGGLLGAIFNFFNKHLHRNRVKLQHPVFQGLEVYQLTTPNNVWECNRLKLLKNMTTVSGSRINDFNLVLYDSLFLSCLPVSFPFICFLKLLQFMIYFLHKRDINDFNTPDVRLITLFCPSVCVILLRIWHIWWGLKNQLTTGPIQPNWKHFI